METPKSQNEKKIVFFDGVCHLCNNFVSLIVKCNKQKKLHLATLQGKTAQELLAKDLREGLESIVFLKKEKIYTNSSAVLQIFISLGGFFKIFYLAYIIPAFIRDFIYQVIAKRRYSFFGKSSTCRLPTAEEKTYFLD